MERRRNMKKLFGCSVAVMLCLGLLGNVSALDISPRAAIDILDKDTNEFIYNSSGTYVGSVRCHSKVEVRRIGSTFSYSILNKSNDGFYPSGSSYTCNVSNLTNIQQGNNYLVRWNAQVKRGSGVDRNQTLTHKY